MDILVDIYDYISSPYGAKRILVMGGEPVEQPEHLLHMLMGTLKSYGVEVILFTSYDISNIPNSFKLVCDGIKCGKFVLDKMDDNHYSGGMKLATTNQELYRRGVDY